MVAVAVAVVVGVGVMVVVAVGVGVGVMVAVAVGVGVAVAVGIVVDMKRELILENDGGEGWEAIIHEAIRMRASRVYSSVKIKAGRSRVEVLAYDNAVSVWTRVSIALRPDYRSAKGQTYKKMRGSDEHG